MVVRVVVAIRCESFSTYPRTYDLIHASNAVSKVLAVAGCNMDDLLLEMDRVLRPGGIVILRDTRPVVARVGRHLKALNWQFVKRPEVAQRDAVTSKKAAIEHLTIYRKLFNAPLKKKVVETSDEEEER